MSVSLSPWAVTASTAAPREQGAAPWAQQGWGAESCSHTGEENSLCNSQSDRSVSDKFGQLQGYMTSEQKFLEY